MLLGVEALNLNLTEPVVYTKGMAPLLLNYDLDEGCVEALALCFVLGILARF